MAKTKTNDKLYRHYVDDAGKFCTECYAIARLMLIPAAYRLEQNNARGEAMDVPAAWIDRPRAAELWTADPDPERAYKILLASAKKDLDNARGRLAVYEKLYDKLSNAMKKGDDAL